MISVILVSGSRTWTDKKTIRKFLKQYDKRKTLFIHGKAKGFDQLFDKLAKKRGFGVAEVEANWNFYHRAAGPIRNGWMLWLKPCRMFAFHKNIKQSKGTKNCLLGAKKRNIPTKVIKVLT